MNNLTPEMALIKERMKATWSAGDFGQIAKIIEEEAKKFTNRLNIKKGMKFLDVASGTGNVSIPAAQTGAIVTGIDIAPNLVTQAKERAKENGLSIRFDEGDAEKLPYNDNEFDMVASMFGVMFAPRPDTAASELLRVTRPAGTIALACWTPEGFVGKMMKLIGGYLPLPPGVSPPVLWGTREFVKEKIAHGVSEFRFRKIMCEQKFDMEPPEIVEHFKTYFGPMHMAFKMLDPMNQEKLRADLIKLWNENNKRRDRTVEVDAEYLETIAVKK